MQLKLSIRRSKCDACIANLALPMAGVGLLASISSTIICNYFIVSGSQDELSLGLWLVPSRNDTNSVLECQGYPSGITFDSYFQTARIMSVLAPVFCCIGIAISYCAESGLIRFYEGRLLLSVFVLVLASVAQGLTLMVLESDVCVNNPVIPGDGTCDLSTGAKISISSVAFMAASIFLLLVTGHKSPER